MQQWERYVVSSWAGSLPRIIAEVDPSWQLMMSSMEPDAHVATSRGEAVFQRPRVFCSNPACPSCVPDEQPCEPAVLVKQGDEPAPGWRLTDPGRVQGSFRSEIRTAVSANNRFRVTYNDGNWVYPYKRVGPLDSAYDYTNRDAGPGEDKVEKLAEHGGFYFIDGVLSCYRIACVAPPHARHQELAWRHESGGLISALWRGGYGAVAPADAPGTRERRRKLASFWDAVVHVTGQSARDLGLTP